MNPVDQIRAWKDTDYRAQLTPQQREAAGHPAGMVELDESELHLVSGGLPKLTFGDACQMLSINKCQDSVTWLSC